MQIWLNMHNPQNEPCVFRTCCKSGYNSRGLRCLQVTISNLPFFSVTTVKCWSNTALQPRSGTASRGARARDCWERKTWDNVLLPSLSLHAWPRHVWFQSAHRQNLSSKTVIFCSLKRCREAFSGLDRAQMNFQFLKVHWVLLVCIQDREVISWTSLLYGLFKKFIN